MIGEKKRKLNINSYIPYIIAFFVPAAAMLVIFAVRRIFPFGERSFLRTDLYHQYAPFFQEYKEKLDTGESIFYSWSTGLGNNFFAMYAYYLSSPLNWLLWILPKKFVIEYITYSIVLRMALASTTMTYYLNRRANHNPLAAALFGIFYGMSGYMAAYSWNIMWMDCLALFPLVILGLEWLVKEKKCVLYCVTLALCMYSNYYIAMIICFSLVLYFLYLLVVYQGERKDYIRAFLNFAGYSVLAAGLASIMLMPQIASLSSTASGSVSFPKTITSYFSTLETLGRHLLGVDIEIGLKHWPNLYCGVAILLFVPLYLCSRKIRWKEKIAGMVLAAIFVFSFRYNITSFIWHGLHYPSSLPCRQSFVYVFILLAMGYEGFDGLKEQKKKWILISTGIAFAFVGLIALQEGKGLMEGADSYYEWSDFYLSVAFLAGYAVLIYVYVFVKAPRKVLACAAVVLVGLEAYLNMENTSITTINRTNYVRDDEKVAGLVEELEEEENGNFFRMERVAERTKNDGAWFGYNSISAFSSTAYANVTDFYSRIGLEASQNKYSFNGTTWVSDMFLGVKYSLAWTEQPEDPLRQLVKSDGSIRIYKNTYALPIGFMVDNNLADRWDTTGSNPAGNWNNLAAALGISRDLFVGQSHVVDNDTDTVQVTTDRAGYVYVFVEGTSADQVRVSYNNISKDFSQIRRPHFLSLGRLEAGTVLTVENIDSSRTGKAIHVYAYVMEEDTLEAVYDALNREPLEVISYNSKEINGKIRTLGGTMFTTIPYDTGWSVYVDGKKVDVSAIEDTFLSFEVPEGLHVVRLRYFPRGLVYGVFVSMLSLILLVLVRKGFFGWKEKAAKRIHLWKKVLVIYQEEKDKADSAE